MSECHLSAGFQMGWTAYFWTSGLFSYTGGYTPEVHSSNGGHVLFSCVTIHNQLDGQLCTVRERSGDLTTPGTLTADIYAGNRLSDQAAGAPDVLVPGVGPWQGILDVW